MLTEPAMTAAIAAVCTASFLEGTGVPWPGVYIVAGAAATLERGAPSVLLVAVLAAASYCLGSLVQYSLGYLCGAKALSWLPAGQRTKLEKLADRYGPALVCWSRPFAIGNYVSLPAGLIRMPLPRFLAYTVAGVLPWGVGAALAGQLVGARAGQYLNRIMEWMVPAALVMSAAALAWILWKWRSGAAGAARRVCPDNQSQDSGGR